MRKPIRHRLEIEPKVFLIELVLGILLEDDGVGDVARSILGRVVMDEPDRKDMERDHQSD